MLRPGNFEFKTIREIGRGGLGKVMEIEITNSNQSLPVGIRLALKKLNEQWTNDPTALKRFEREIEALKAMNHPSILQIQGENLKYDERFYCMNLYCGSLRKWIVSTKRKPSYQEVANFSIDIADALSYAHANGFYHRDIKPENILLDDNNSPIVADWGLGYFVHVNSMVMTSLTIGGMGTEYYCSAEQWETGKCGPEGDVYSLGLTIAELITGKQNAIDTVGAGITYNIIPERSEGARLFNQLIKDMTHSNPNCRIDNMDHVITLLTDIVDF